MSCHLSREPLELFLSNLQARGRTFLFRPLFLLSNGALTSLKSSCNNGLNGPEFLSHSTFPKLL